jgi:hypothetical protein
VLALLTVLVNTWSMWRLEDVLKQLKEKQESYGSMNSYASNVGCTTSYISQVLSGKKEPSQRLLDEIGLEKIVMYKPKSKKWR